MYDREVRSINSRRKARNRGGATTRRPFLALLGTLLMNFRARARGFPTTTHRAALERFGLVHEHEKGMPKRPMCVGRHLRKKAALRPWVVAPITMAATPANPAGGGNFGVAALPTRTTTAEVRFCHRSPRYL